MSALLLPAHERQALEAGDIRADPRVKPDGKKPMEAKAFAAGIQGIKQGGIEWQEIHG